MSEEYEKRSIVYWIGYGKKYDIMYTTDWQEERYPTCNQFSLPAFDTSASIVPVWDHMTPTYDQEVIHETDEPAPITMKSSDFSRTERLMEFETDSMLYKNENFAGKASFAHKLYPWQKKTTTFEWYMLDVSFATFDPLVSYVHCDLNKSCTNSIEPWKITWDSLEPEFYVGAHDSNGDILEPYPDYECDYVTTVYDFETMKLLRQVDDKGVRDRYDLLKGWLFLDTSADPLTFDIDPTNMASSSGTYHIETHCKVPLYELYPGEPYVHDRLMQWKLFVPDPITYDFFVIPNTAPFFVDGSHFDLIWYLMAGDDW